jgi:hypothetical protein
MARTVASLPAGSRITDYISLGVIAKFFPLERVRDVLAETKRASVRERDLPAHVVVYYVIALALYMRSSTREVLRCLLEGVQWLLDPSVRVKVAGKSGISQARSRLGAEPLRRLYTGLVGPIAEKRTKGAWYRDWRLVSLDGSSLGVSSQGHIVQSVRDRPRLKDSGLVAREAPWRESKTAEPSDNILGKECAQRTRLQRAVNADVASLHESPVAETVYNARKQQGLAETSPIRQLSPAGYQRRHGVKDDVETGEALGARRRNLAEEMPAITVSGKCRHRHQGGGSGRSTVDGRAAKRARREGPGPASVPLAKARQG